MKMLSATIAIVLLTLGTQAVAQDLKIGYVNGLRIQQESALKAPEVERIKQEFAAREQQLQELFQQGRELQIELEKNGVTMSPADRQAREKRLAMLAQQFEKLQRGVAEDLEVRKNEARARFLAEANAIIRAIAEAGDYDLIVEQAVYGSAQIDITEQVLEEMAKRAAAAPDSGK